MPIIRFAKGQPEIQVPSGAQLMLSVLEAGIPVASSCKGDGVCGKCRMTVVAGAEHLNPPNEIENFLIEKFNLSRTQRISCQTKVLGDIEIDTPYW